MTLALQREPTAYISLLMRLGAVLADSEPMLARLVRAAALPWPSLLACPLLHAATALLNPSRGSELSYTAVAMEREQIVYSSLLTLAGAV